MVSSVHTIETSAPDKIPNTYREHCASKIPEEYSAAEHLYQKVASVHMSNHHDRFLKCRTFSWFTRHRETGKVRVATAQCRLRWCPLCAAARANWIRFQVEEWIQSAKQPKFLTLTLKHSDAPLEHQIKHLYESFRRLRQVKSIKKLMTGGVWFFQIKRSKRSGQWHPHLHAVIEGKFIPQKLIRANWVSITMTSDIVDVRTVKSAEKVSEYIARYASKPSLLKDLSEPDQYELYTALKGRRLCGKWGTVKELQLKSGSPPDTGFWENIGSWRIVKEMSLVDIRAKSIIFAWQTGTSLPNTINFSTTDDWVNGKIDDFMANLNIDEYFERMVQR